MNTESEESDYRMTFIDHLLDTYKDRIHVWVHDVGSHVRINLDSLYLPDKYLMVKKENTPDYTFKALKTYLLKTFLETPEEQHQLVDTLNGYLKFLYKNTRIQILCTKESFPKIDLSTYPDRTKDTWCVCLGTGFNYPEAIKEGDNPTEALEKAKAESVKKGTDPAAIIKVTYIQQLGLLPCVN